MQRQEQQGISPLSDMVSLVLRDRIFRSTTIPLPPSFQPPRSINRRRLPSRRGQPKYFALFIKIAFQYLDQIDNPSLLLRAKYIVAECTRRNRQGDVDYMPLQQAIQDRLQCALGKHHWAHVQGQYHVYCQQHRRQHIIAAV